MTPVEFWTAVWQTWGDLVTNMFPLIEGLIGVIIAVWVFLWIVRALTGGARRIFRSGKF